MELVEISGNSWMNPHKYRQEVTNMQVQELVGIVPWNFIATICNLFIQVYAEDAAKTVSNRPVTKP